MDWNHFNDTLLTIISEKQEKNRVLESSQLAEEISVSLLYNERLVTKLENKVLELEKTRQALERLGYRVETRSDRIEALELFRIRPDVPIILCTGYSDKIQDENARSIGVRAVVMKPVLRKEIAPLIREILDKKVSGGSL